MTFINYVKNGVIFISISFMSMCTCIYINISQQTHFIHVYTILFWQQFHHIGTHLHHDSSLWTIARNNHPWFNHNHDWKQDGDTSAS